MGTHVLAELYGCTEDLDNEKLIEEILIEAAKRCGATILNVSTHKFYPQGVTVIIALAESHISIHTWPEGHCASVDAFTCGDIDPEIAIDYIIAELGSSDFDKKIIIRGR